VSDRTVKRAPRWFYQVARTVVITFCKIWFRVSYEGTDRLPKDAPYVIAPIHRSNVDTFVVGCMTRRRVRFMAKDSLWKVKPLGVFIETVGGFPVRRGSADVEAIKTALGLLAEGEPVVLFPEGARQTGPIVQPLFDGAVYVAAKAGVPIVPVGVGGSERCMPKGSKLIYPYKVHVIVGDPISPPAIVGRRVDRAELAKVTDELSATLQTLFDAAQIRAGVR
jgi:1-acyl-sn-glycerol-3-phosphate acyltransferase